MDNPMSELFATLTKPFNSWSDTKLAFETKQVSMAMPNNPAFPDTQPTNAAFTSAVDAFIDALGSAGSRNADAVAVKNTKRFILVQLCSLLVNSVTDTAKGKREALVSTRLPIKKTPQPRVLRTPEHFTVTNGINPGELYLKVKGSNAASIIFEYTEDPPTATSVWTRTTCTKSSCTISGLEAGKKFWFRVAAIGSRSQVAWGETILSPYVQ